MHLFHNTSCVILAAGNSERMGQNKALLRFDSDSNFLQKVINTYLDVGMDELIVVVSKQLADILGKEQPIIPAKVKVVVNHHPELGRFYSLQQGLCLVTKGHFCFFQNIDNPFTSSEILYLLMANRKLANVITPFFGMHKGHPVLLSDYVIHAIVQCKNTNIRIDHFLSTHTNLSVEVQDDKILANVNTKSEYYRLGLG